MILIKPGEHPTIAFPERNAKWFNIQYHLQSFGSNSGHLSANRADTVTFDSVTWNLVTYGGNINYYLRFGQNVDAIIALDNS